jgi:hypothetical protein
MFQALAVVLFQCILHPLDCLIETGFGIRLVATCGQDKNHKPTNRPCPSGDGHHFCPVLNTGRGLSARKRNQNQISRQRSAAFGSARWQGRCCAGRYGPP